MRKPFLFLLIILYASGLSAQVTAPVIINTGEILFQQPKTVTFKIENTGTTPMTITDVHPACGCTQVEWSKTPIDPGQAATLTVTYDAKLLGTFQKEIEVWTDTAQEPTYLTLQGRVVTTASDYEGDFPIDLGSVRLSSNTVEFDDVNMGDRPEVMLQIVNTGRGNYKPQIMHPPSYLTARYQPEQLAGGRVGRIIFTLDSEQLKSYGLTQTTVYLARHLGDKVSAENEIDVSALLLPAFAHLTAEQLRTAPHLTLSSDVLDFSAIGNKKKMTQTLLVTNTGERPLNVSRVQVYGNALTVSLSDRVIKPGKRAKLKVTLNAENLKKAKSSPRILLITDDPQRPKTIIKLKD